MVRNDSPWEQGKTGGIFKVLGPQQQRCLCSFYDAYHVPGNKCLLIHFLFFANNFQRMAVNVQRIIGEELSFKNNISN